MTQLNQQQCQACDRLAVKLSEQYAQQLLSQLPAWVFVQRDAVSQLARTFRFNNFVDALAFTNRVGAMAEQQGHHPDLVTRWGAVEVYWWSHKLKGLHINDFICAAKTDRLYLAD